MQGYDCVHCDTMFRRAFYLVWYCKFYSFRQRTCLHVGRVFKRYLLQRGIASSFCSVYHPSGNGQAERTVGTVWKAIRLALSDKGLPLSHWEVVLEDVMHSLRSLSCTATNTTSHERFFNFQRRSCSGESLPSWFTGTRTA